MRPWAAILGQVRHPTKKLKVADSDKEEIFTEIGYALSLWTFVESYLVAILSLLLAADPERVGIVMYYNMNVSSWFSLISDLLSLSPEMRRLKDRWNSEISELRRLKDLRDRLAHQPVWVDSPDLVVRAALLDLRMKSAKQKPLTIRELQNFSISLLAMRDWLRGFMTDLRTVVLQSSSPDKSSQREADQPRSQTQAHENPIAPEPPHPPSPQ